MGELNTKERIIKASIRLFNEVGISNVRLLQIAADVGISPGNLAYHFRNKEAIVEAIYDDLQVEISQILSAFRIYPNLMDFDLQLMAYFTFILKYPFYFLDLLEIKRHYPAILKKRESHIQKMVGQIRMRFDFNVNRGILIKEPCNDQYDICSESIWVLISFWMPQNVIRGTEVCTNEKAFREFIWNQILPYFTPEGKKEYNQLIKPLIIGSPYNK